MTPRSIRRAAERKAKKTALKAQGRLTPELLADSHQRSRETELPLGGSTENVSEDRHPLPGWSEDNTEQILFSSAPPSNDAAALPSSPNSISKAQLAANRANSQFSTGPTSPEGRASSSLNAVKTALTGRTVLLPTDEATDYEHHLRAWQDDLRPLGARECDLVQSIADTTWRLKRIPCLESAMFAQGRVEFAECFHQYDASMRGSMIELQTFIKYEKQMRNLQLQESRLVRRREKELAEFRQLQQERHEREREALEAAAQLYLEAKAGNEPFEPVANGFVFSSAEIERHLAQTRRQTTLVTNQHRQGNSPKTAKQAA